MAGFTRSRPRIGKVDRVAKSDTPSSDNKKPADPPKGKTTAARKSDTSTSGEKTVAAEAKPAAPPPPAKPAPAAPAPAKKETVSGKDKVESAAPKVEKPVETPPVARKETPVKPETAAEKPQSAAPEKKPDAPASAATPTKPVETAKPAPAPAAPVQPERRSIFWPLVMGGVVAGILGFAVAEMNVLNTRGDTEPLRQSIDAQAERLAALESAEPVAGPDLAGIEGALAALSDQVTALEEQLAALRDRPAPATSGVNDSAAAYAAELAELRDALGSQQEAMRAQQDEIAQLIENARSIEEATADAARAATAQAALAKITAALSTGSGYQSAVEQLSESVTDEVPQALIGNAAEGVPSLQELQSDFPQAARAALSAARTSGADNAGEGFGGFLRRQLGARSVAPREGSDPDAVLSRAEAAVRQGQLGNALAEIATLPEEAQAAMGDWIDAARVRAEAEAAVQDLSQRLTAN